MVAFDTLQIAKELESAFPPEQAEALVKAFAHTLTQDLATKQDLADLKARLRDEIQGLRDEVRGEIRSVRDEIQGLRDEIQSVRDEIRDVRVEIKDVKIDMVKWIVGAIAFNLIGTAGLMITLIKVIPH